MKTSQLIRLGIIVCLLSGGLAAALVFPVKEWLESFLGYIANLGVWGPVLLGVLYVVACVLFIPGSLLTLAAGFLFGLWQGYLAVTVGSVTGATVSFLLGRYLFRDWVEQRIANSDRFRALDNAVQSQGFRIVLLTRLSPAFPFNALNYAFGLTKVSLRNYFLGSLIGMIPGTLLYVYLGTGLKSLTQVLSGQVQGGVYQQVFFAIGLVATIIVTLLITRLAKNALQESNESLVKQESEHTHLSSEGVSHVH